MRESYKCPKCGFEQEFNALFGRFCIKCLENWIGKNVPTCKETGKKKRRTLRDILWY